MGFFDELGSGIAGRWPEGPGGEALGALLMAGLVAPEWSVRHGAGLEWWVGPHAQRIGTTSCERIEGTKVSRILIETDVAHGLLEAPAARQRRDALNQRASFSALVDAGEGRLVLAASLLATEKNRAFTLRMLPAICAMQAAEAGPAAAALAAVGAVPTTSAHPGCGPRRLAQPEIGELASHILARYPAPPLDPRIFSDVAATLGDVGLEARADARGLDAELPFAGETAVLQILAPIEHPGIGSGVLCLLVLPVLALRHALEREGAAALLDRLNAQTRRHAFHADSLPALGGWAPDPASGHPALAAFVPAALAHDEVLTDLAMAQLARGLLLARCFDAAVEAPDALARLLDEAI